MPELPTIKTETLSFAGRPTLRDRLMRWLPNSEQVVHFLKTLVWVAPLTLLIWIYAERENSVKAPPESVSIDVKTSDSNRLVTLRRPPDKNIIVELEGPRAKLDKVHEELQPKANGKAAVQIEVDPLIGLGGQELLTVGQINNLPIFKNNGVTVKSAQPPYLFVDIDRFEEADAQVVAPKELADVLENARFVPDTVKIRAPSQLLHKAEADLKGNPLTVTADIAKRAELKGKTGKVDLEGVLVYWTYRENVTISPARVAANLVIRQQYVQYTLPKAVPIVKETPFDFENRYFVDYLSSIPNVVVKGPADVIEELKKGGASKIRARLEIKGNDPPRTQIKRPLEFNLPQGVTLTDETAERANWPFEIKDR
jgi:hypothetical protein